MPSALRQFDLIVLGAGAAGLFCAGEAARRGRRVAVLDHGSRPGRKILASGGGRCNFTNLGAGAANYLSGNPHFVKSALAQFGPRDFLERVERQGIGWHEKTLGQLFCNQSSRQILDLLLAECEAGKVFFLFDSGKIAVQKEENYRVETARGVFEAEALVVATGGLSYPKLGATGLGYELARQFGLKVVMPRPALVPLLLAGEEARWTALTGLAAEVEIAVGKVRFRENLLVTHRGLSGPAILQASSYWRPGEEISVDFLPSRGRVLDALLDSGKREEKEFRKSLRAALPQRLADFLAGEARPSGWSNAAIVAAEERLHDWRFHPSGTEGFARAEVTAGGVDTAGLDSKTMAARRVEGLFFIGEVVDVTGWLGGYNFQWAWSSAMAAARAL